LEDVGEARRADSRAAVHLRFIRQATELQRRPGDLPRRVIVFGISSLPSQFLEALEAVARVSQVLLCVHNPCEHYWADIVADKDLLRAERRRHAPRESMPATLTDAQLHLHAHPLLAAWGKQGRDYIRLLDEHDEPERYRELFEALPWQRIDLFQSHGRDTLLRQLQDDIRALRPLAETRDTWPPLDPELDGSIRFHVAHSAQREVEILHDQLLAQFSANRNLRPRDVIVMVPDIDTYAPHIQAVFGQIDPGDSRYIPFTLADQGQRGMNPLLIALERLLRLPESRLAVSDLLDLLDLPAVRERFGISESDLPTLHRWVEGAGVRWGLDGGQRQKLGLPPGLEQNTWRFGLRRMLLGYAAGMGEAWQDVEPYDEVGGLDAALVGPMIQLVDALDQQWRALTTPAGPALWGERLRALLDTFFLPVDSRDTLSIAQLLDALEQWETVCAAAGMDEALPLTVVRESWLAAADERTLTQRFLAGAVNFCTLMPMRAIPFEVVCLLGMNDGDYPRSQPPLDFDLMATDYRPGDRSRREDDRYLFLEALLSARQALYISWVGRSILDNGERPPSVLVGQLRDHLASGWRLAGLDPARDPGGKRLLEALTLQHPLQPFSRAYFPVAGDGALFTYAREWRQVHDAGPEHPADAASLPLLEQEVPLTLSGLAGFLRNPVRAFFNQRLKVYFDDDRSGGDDLEPFALDALQQWQLQDDLIQAVLDVADDEAAAAACLQAEVARLERTGCLPMGGLALPVKEALSETVTAFLDHYRDVLAHYPIRQEEPLQIRHQHADVLLEDWLGGLRRNADGGLALVHVRAGTLLKRRTLKCHNLVRPWVSHLAAHACGYSLVSRVVGADGCVDMAPLARDDACCWLEALLAAWRAGMQAPLGVACKTAFAWLENAHKGEEQALEAARLAYDGGGFQSRGERGEDACLARAWPAAGQLFADATFRGLVDGLYRPLFENVTHSATTGGGRRTEAGA
ncbi:MAG: exodeoxyribonuclease V subunit gamma, partial [Aquisalimonadaceae bacterium]